MSETSATGTVVSQKLKRKALVHYLDAMFNETGTYWYKIGKHVEDMSIELNPSLDSFTNILDETAVEDNGYEPSTDVDTYYADPADGVFYTKLKDITMNRLTDDDCKTTILEVLIDGTSSSYDAWTEDVIVKPQSYGGATGGVRIPYSITFCGNRQYGTVAFSSKTPVFTASTSDSEY
ncbi:MAG: hypothetical protein LIO40_00015 [Ruminococcus sp.]|nr:hypothetical protein [Ruminococcus sp.]